MMLTYDSFTPIEMDAKEKFDKHYSKYFPYHSDNVFTTMISWMDYANYEYLFHNDTLCVKTTVNDVVQFRMPHGKHSKEMFDSLLKIAKNENLECPFGLIEKEDEKWINQNYPDINLISTPEYFDYVYLSSDLASLTGSKYSKIRNRLHKFTKNFNYEIKNVYDVDLSEIKQFLKRWCIWKNCEKDPLLSYERKAISYSINNFNELGLSGIVVIADGNIEAISIFEPMNPDTIVIHFEKGSADFDGIYKCVNQETAKIVQNDYKFINRESDMGNPGLKKAKMSYRPDHMVEVFKMKI